MFNHRTPTAAKHLENPKNTSLHLFGEIPVMRMMWFIIHIHELLSDKKEVSYMQPEYAHHFTTTTYVGTGWRVSDLILLATKDAT